jgi:hypothetical protein
MSDAAALKNCKACIVINPPVSMRARQKGTDEALVSVGLGMLAFAFLKSYVDYVPANVSLDVSVKTPPPRRPAFQRMRSSLQMRFRP